MALTGLQIFKLLPKKNCKECANPTCLAFAMALAAGKATLDQCPYASEEAKEALGAATQPPIATIEIGTGEQKRIVGDETVLFRHDKTFFHPTVLTVEISDKLTGAELDAKIEKVNGLSFERVGQHVSIDMIAVVNESGCADAFEACVKAVAAKSKFALTLVTTNVDAMAKALAICGASKPLVYAATKDNADAMTELAKKYDAPLAVLGEGLDATAALVEKIAASYKKLVIDTGARDTANCVSDLVQIRRQAIKKKFRPFGYPTIAFTSAITGMQQAIQATSYIAKYASIVVLKTDEKQHILPLTAWRMNLYTDPQKPSQVEPGIFAVGAADENSPVYCTTNFALTYYTVEGEVSASKVPSWMIACPTDGTSVLTAWAAGKFTPDKIAAFVEEINLKEKVAHNDIIIPGYVAVIKGSLEEKCGRTVILAPAEASGIPAFAKAKYAK